MAPLSTPQADDQEQLPSSNKRVDRQASLPPTTRKNFRRRSAIVIQLQVPTPWPSLAFQFVLSPPFSRAPPVHVDVPATSSGPSTSRNPHNLLNILNVISNRTSSDKSLLSPILQVTAVIAVRSRRRYIVMTTHFRPFNRRPSVNGKMNCAPS